MKSAIEDTKTMIDTMAEALTASPKEKAAAMVRFEEMQPVFESFESRMRAADPILLYHTRELIAHACDIVEHLKADFDPMVVKGILSVAAGIAFGNKEDLWQDYTENVAPKVNADLLKYIDTEGEPQ